MSVTGKIGRKNLMLNKTRSAITVIGIALSVALLTVVACLATSAVATTRDEMGENGGNWHLYFPYDSLDEKGISTIRSSDLVDTLYTTQEIGLGDLSGSYFNVVGMSESDFSTAGFYIDEGKYSFEEGNVFIPMGTLYNDKELTVGDGFEMELETPSGELTTYKFTVAGIIYNYASLAEYSMGTDGVIITAESGKYGEGYESYFVILTEEGIKQWETFADSVSDVYDTSELLNNLTKTFTWRDIPQYATFGVFLLVIVLISQYCIKNSFDISVKERIRQLAILKSIGATSRQIRRSIYAEAAAMSLIAIPLGILLGIAFCVLVFKAGSGIVSFTLNINAVTVVIAVFFSLLTVLLASSNSARTASRVTPVETIKNTEDIKVSSHNRKLKVPGFISKLFGVGGGLAYKNLVRNRKKYKTIEVSIVLCVAVFIVVVFFKDFMVEAFGGFLDNPYSFDVAVTLSVTEDDDETELLKQTVEKVKSVSGISSYSVLRMTLLRCDLKYTEESKQAFENFGGDSRDDSEAYIYLVSLGEDEYARLLAAEGLDADDMKGAGFLFNNPAVYTEASVIHPDVFDVKANDTVTLWDGDDTAEKKSVEIKAVLTDAPVGCDYESLIVSDEYYNKLTGSEDYTRRVEGSQEGVIEIFVKSENPSAVAKELKSYFNKVGTAGSVWDATEEYTTYKSALKVVEIAITLFIVTVALVGLTNMMNTVAANMMGRAKEFAVFRSIGMTNKEFRRMIVLEDMVFCLRAFIQAVFIAVFFIFAISFAVKALYDVPFRFPWEASLIGIGVVILLMVGVTAVSLRKALNQNIISTIRDDTF